MGKAPRQSFDKTRADGKRVAGQQDFGVPGSGGSSPESNLQDIDHIPMSQGGQKKQPRGPHVHDQHITGTSIGKRTPLIDANWKMTGQARY
ncbi:MAG: hypothetical protein NZ770_06030, partial [Candidatus Poseidoniaceae archaeon]|nr:hypothetical protein [Candidatus Poseidoniaceae archaeon]